MLIISVAHALIYAVSSHSHFEVAKCVSVGESFATFAALENKIRQLEE